MNKTFHFLTGLPRTGNTLLSAILNQNPNIYSSPISPLPTLMWTFKDASEQDESAKRLENNNGVNNILNNFVSNYYNDVNKPNIIIREKAFATPANLYLIKEHINPKPKIIFTIRPIIEILASWINILPEWSHIDQNMKDSNFYYKTYLTHNDNRCDFIMQTNGQLDKLLLTINEIIKPENKDIFCLVKYNDIVNSPEQTLNKIYNFLELPHYKHNFNKIEKKEIDNDEILGLPADLHKIRPQLKKISKDPKEVLSEYVINKYSNMGWEGL